MNEDEQTRALLARMRQDMPALQGIGVDCLHLSQDHVRLAAPLARNQNDKQQSRGSIRGPAGNLKKQLEYKQMPVTSP